MNVHRAPLACTLLILIACVLFPKAATAQYTADQCNLLNDGAREAFKQRSWKEQVSLLRKKLGFCRQYMTRDEYSWALEELAFALNKDNQHGEALSVANRCME